MFRFCFDFNLHKYKIKNSIKKEGIKLIINSMPSFVRRKGLEPPRLSTLDPKSSAATNYANAASLGLRLQSYDFYLDCASVLLIFFVWFIFLLLRW